MNMDEAISKYSISIPSDQVFYSAEYIEYFKSGKKDNGEYEIFRPFQEMYNKSFIATCGNNATNKGKKGKKAVVLGGQIGAGKSGLAQSTYNEFNRNGSKIYIIDDDQYRKFYPKAREILSECPEYYIPITAIGTGPVTPKVMQCLVNSGENFIFDGTMKNDRILNTMQTWSGYDITCKIMATSKIESLISMFERNEFLRKNGSGRLITVNAHNITYDGLEQTVSHLQNLQLPVTVEVYIRGESIQFPQMIYSSNQEFPTYHTPLEALKDGRRMDLKRVLTTGNIQQRIDDLYRGEGLNEVEASALGELKSEVDKEMETIIR